MVKTTIKLLLIYFAIQICVMFPIAIYSVINSMAKGGEPGGAISMTGMAIGTLLSAILLSLYLYKKHYFNTDKQTWEMASPVKMILLCLALVLSYNILYDVFATYVPLPNLLEDMFIDMSGNLFGILAVVIVGPIMEELLFRGTFMRLFMQKLSPAQAIFVSALIFGLVHGNPAQVVNAFFIGLLLGWIYYKTGSLLPVILIHILNNGASVFLMRYYPDAKYLVDLTGPTAYWYWISGAAILFILSLVVIKKMKAVDWPVPQVAELTQPEASESVQEEKY
ncbi:CPBP family intramembrane metalloprotease [Parabacteroides sp. 52]|nr:membrane protease YdiL (CAAX protease family) [Parabacteroides sp. PM5-20]NDV55932.1 CPBP family intramembrane metalloprotease [Parabacteroides sp. 52]